jgi:cytochrome b subunit of formate dehydrogenase
MYIPVILFRMSFCYIYIYSELCGHVFEKEAIEQLLNIASLKTRKVKCPHIGKFNSCMIGGRSLILAWIIT